MPYRVNGFGTALVRASRVRKVSGKAHFDAVEAVTVAYLPVWAYKVLHVTRIHPKGYVGDREEYDYLLLRWSWRIVAKAFLRCWAGCCLLVGTFLLPLFGHATWNMEREVTRTDVIILSSLGVLLVVGVGIWLFWRWVDGRDMRLREILGAAGIGFSDPYDWTAELARTRKEQLLDEAGAESLVQIARAAHEARDASKAMLCLRLAQREPPSPQADALCNTLSTNWQASSEWGDAN